MSEIRSDSAQKDILNRLRRAEGQLRGIQRMVEDGENCMKIGQQFAAVRKALDSTYLRMTLCYVDQELQERLHPQGKDNENVQSILQDMETLLARMI